MMNSGANRSRIVYIIAACLSLVLVVGLTIGTLMLIVPRKVSQAHGSSIQKTTSAALVSQLKEHPQLAQLKGFSVEATSGTVHGALEYRSPSKAYAVVVDTSDEVTLIGKAPLAFTAVSSALGNWLKSYGFTASLGTTTLSTATYENSDIVCHLSGSNAAAITAYVFACVPRVAIASAYSMQEPLLALYKKSVPTGISPYATVREAYAKKGTMQSALLTLTAVNATQPPRILLFGAVNGTWEFIADLSTDLTAKGTYALSSTQTQALLSPKYGTFLLDQLHS